MKRKRHISGFTLIEILVSVGILATIAIVVAQAFFTVLRSNSKTEILKDVKQSGEQAILTMTRLIKQAQEITSECEADGAESSSLSLVNADGGTTTFACNLDAGVTRIASVSGSTEYLTDRQVTIGGESCAAATLTFVCTAMAGLPSKVTVSFFLTQTGTSEDQAQQAQESFQSTVLIRNERP